MSSQKGSYLGLLELHENVMFSPKMTSQPYVCVTAVHKAFRKD
jgi:hypothetical protein